MGYIRMPKP